MINSKFRELGDISLADMDIELSMIPFDLATLEGIPSEYTSVVKSLIKEIKAKVGTAFFTVHGKFVRAGNTLRRPGAHTDGNYLFHEINNPQLDWRGGWKLGQNGPYLNTDEHIRSYLKKTGGIILASTYPACLGWSGKFRGNPRRGGDCTHISLGSPIALKANRVYYGNNEFIHESIPVDKDTHRTFYRITLPENHVFESI